MDIEIIAIPKKREVQNSLVLGNREHRRWEQGIGSSNSGSVGIDKEEKQLYLRELGKRYIQI
ncbi:MAG: hypothetical protein AAGJ08_05250 [Cyanobacteria bacterium P01_H01_bin.35]